MAATKYSYSISGDFPNQKEDTDRLTKEIADDATITTAFDYINTAGDDCDIWFADVLSAPEVTALDTVVANHSGDPIVYTERAYEESLPLLLTSSTAWTQKLRLSLPNCHAATYRLEWSFEWGTTSSSFPIYVRVQVDDTTDINEYAMVAVQAGTAYAGNGFTQVVLTEGAHYVDIDVKAANADYSVGIRKVRLEAVEVK
jgi:hypothetical protein